MRETARVLSACVATLLSVGLAAADSPFDISDDHPRDRRSVVTFKLNSQQDREVQRLRLFRPTPAQLEILRTAMPTCGNLLRVVTPRYVDCGDGLFNIALWDRPGEVDVPLEYLAQWMREEVFLLQVAAVKGDSSAIRELANPTIYPALTDTTVLYKHSSGPPQRFCMDMDGDVYCEGESVDNEAILKLLARPVEDSEGVQSETDPLVIYLDLPPPGSRHDEALRLWDILELAHLVGSKGFKLVPGN